MTVKTDTLPPSTDLTPPQKASGDTYAGTSSLPELRVKQVWEGEGGAIKEYDLAGAVGADSILTGHISKAHEAMESGNIEAAVNDLESAVTRFISYRMLVQSAMDDTINQLSSTGCHASAPHPKALKLIKLRQKLTT